MKLAIIFFSITQKFIEQNVKLEFTDFTYSQQQGEHKSI